MSCGALLVTEWPPRSARFGASCPRRSNPSAIDRVRDLKPPEGEGSCGSCRPGRVAILCGGSALGCMSERATAFRSCPSGLICGRPDISTSFSHRHAALGSSGALRCCTGGGMIVVPLIGVRPSIKVNKNPGVSEAMHALKEPRGSRQPQASSPNTSLQRTVRDQVHAPYRVRLRKGLLPCAAAPRTAAELNR
jgi:hypothetical protein